MTQLVGLVGAPGSGKSTLAARLYAELLERGINSSRLISEYAIEWLGQGNVINFNNQKIITRKQIELENYAKSCNFDPIICDSAVWLGGVYAKFNSGQSREEDNRIFEYVEDLDIHLNKYAITIYVPLFDKIDKVNQFRVHDSSDAIELDKLIQSKLKSVNNVYKAPKKLADREHFIKYVAGEIHDGKLSEYNI